MLKQQADASSDNPYSNVKLDTAIAIIYITARSTVVCVLGWGRGEGGGDRFDIAFNSLFSHITTGSYLKALSHRGIIHKCFRHLT